MGNGLLFFGLSFLLYFYLFLVLEGDIDFLLFPDKLRNELIGEKKYQNVVIWAHSSVGRAVAF